MKILAIDSSGMPASVAVCEDGIMLAEYTVNHKRTHSQTLVPMLEEIRRVLDIDISGIDAVAVAGGPGSFTGLRIGSATAKGIGLALGKPLVHVPTLEAMAYNFYGSECLIAPMIDARRNQVFAGIYSFTSQDCLDIVCDQEPMDVTGLCGRLDLLSNETGRKVILLGDGASAYRCLIEDHLKAQHMYAPPHLSQQRAGAVAARAAELIALGRTESAAMHRPDYLRVSQAERVREEKKAAAVKA